LYSPATYPVLLSVPLPLFCLSPSLPASRLLILLGPLLRDLKQLFPGRPSLRGAHFKVGADPLRREKVFPAPLELGTSEISLFVLVSRRKSSYPLHSICVPSTRDTVTSVSQPVDVCLTFRRRTSVVQREHKMSPVRGCPLLRGAYGVDDEILIRLTGRRVLQLPFARPRVERKRLLPSVAGFALHPPIRSVQR